MKSWLWIPFLLTLFFLGDRLAGGVCKKLLHDSGFRYSRMYRGEAAAQVLLLGNSRGLGFYQPFIEAKTGKKTFNLSYNGLPADVAKALVLDYFDRYPAPEVLVIDVTMCDRYNEPLMAGFAAYRDVSPRLDSLLREKSPDARQAARLSWLYACNNELFQRALYYHGRSDEDWLLDRTIAPALADEVASRELSMLAQPYLLEQLKGTCEAARSRGVRVELVVAPYYPGFGLQHLPEFLEAVEKKCGQKVRDYSRSISDPALFGDFTHVNKKGSAVWVEMMVVDGVLRE